MLVRHPTARQECCGFVPAPEEGARSVQNLWNALFSPDLELPFPLEKGGNFIFQKMIFKADFGWVQGRCSRVRVGSVFPPAQPKMQFLPPENSTEPA